MAAEVLGHQLIHVIAGRQRRLTSGAFPMHMCSGYSLLNYLFLGTALSLGDAGHTRPLCLDALGTCIAAHPAVFTGSTDCFALLRHTVCVTLLKNLKGCFDFAILIRSISLLQKLLRDQTLARMLMPELQVLLHIMLDLVNADRSPWQRATSLEFLKSVCEDPQALQSCLDL